MRHSQRKRGATDRPDLRDLAPALDSNDERGGVAIPLLYLIKYEMAIGWSPRALLVDFAFRQCILELGKTVVRDLRTGQAQMEKAPHMLMVLMLASETFVFDSSSRSKGICASAPNPLSVTCVPLSQRL